MSQTEKIHNLHFHWRLWHPQSSVEMYKWTKIELSPNVSAWKSCYLCKSKNEDAELFIFIFSQWIQVQTHKCIFYFSACSANRPFEMLHIGPLNVTVFDQRGLSAFFLSPFALKQLCDVSQAIPFANFSWPHSSCTKDLCSLWPLSVSFCELSRQVSLRWNACSQG